MRREALRPNAKKCVCVCARDRARVYVRACAEERVETADTREYKKGRREGSRRTRVERGYKEEEEEEYRDRNEGTRKGLTKRRERERRR